jgi:hypothetical protein
MTKSRLLTVHDAAALIEKVTGETAPNIANKIMAAWKRNPDFPIYYASNGRRCTYTPTCEIEPAGQYVYTWQGIGAGGSTDLFRVDIEQLLTAFAYHPETRAAILAELDNPTPVFNPTKEEAPRGVSKKEILAVDWLKPKQKAPPLEKLLNGRPKWIASAMTSPGSPGKEASFWNPAILAVCLHSDATRRHWKGPSIAELTDVINKHFKEYADEWAQHAERLKYGE